MKKTMLLISLVTLTSALSFADKHGKKAAPATAPAAAAVYKIDTAASTIGWKGSKATGSFHDGNISVKEGQIEVADKVIKSGNIVVDMTTMNNKDLAGSPDYQKKLMEHLKSEDFFAVSKKGNETSNFKFTKVEKKSDTEIVVKGTLTMIGSTQPVEFPATIKMEGDKITGTATVKLDRTKWGLKYGSGKFFKNLGDKLINDEIELTLNLVAAKSM
ncbi:MAG: YceI family protein [Bdellovibrionales bacterium]